MVEINGGLQTTYPFQTHNGLQGRIQTFTYGSQII